MSEKTNSGNLLSQAAAANFLREAFAEGAVTTPAEEAELLEVLSGPDWEAFLDSKEIRDVLQREVESVQSGKTFRMSLD